MILDYRGACAPALEWLQTQPDWQTAWNTCDRREWLMWVIHKFKVPFDQLEYEHACGPAWAKYERACAYNHTCDTDALAKYQRIQDEAEDKLNHVRVAKIRKQVSAKTAWRIIKRVR